RLSTPHCWPSRRRSCQGFAFCSHLARLSQNELKDPMTQDYSANRHLTIDWPMFHRDIHLLAANLVSKGPFKGLIAIARGGLVPAGILSRILDLRLVDTLCISSYDARVQRPG